MRMVSSTGTSIAVMSVGSAAPAAADGTCGSLADMHFALDVPKR